MAQGNFNAIRVKVKGEDNLMTLSAPHPLTRRDIEKLIEFLKDYHPMPFDRRQLPPRT